MSLVVYWLERRKDYIVRNEKLEEHVVGSDEGVTHGDDSPAYHDTPLYK